MNLIDKNLWDYEFPWGTTLSPYFCSSQKDLVAWNEGETLFNVGYDPINKFTAWYRDANWKVVNTSTTYAGGMIVSKEQYGFGTYEMICKLPNFRGSWPAFWFIDISGVMGIPPEIDAFEHFRKDSCLTRHHVTTTYHGGPTYENDWSKHANKYSLCPIDKNDLKSVLVWNSDSFSVFINDKKTLTINRDSSKGFPYKAMNIIVGSGIGNWNPEVKKFAPFVVKSLTYQPL
jgi:beta-glucanase (GH16 family)